MSADRRQAWIEFMATECCVCHAAKRPKNGFCSNCYFTLPRAMQRALWQTFGDGYEETHAKARAWLRQRRETGAVTA